MTWWPHQMETFSALLALCAGNSPATGEFPAQRPVTRSFDVFFDLSLNKRSSKQSQGWWFETPSCSLWRHSNVGCWNFALLYAPRSFYSSPPGQMAAISQTKFWTHFLEWKVEFWWKFHLSLFLRVHLTISQHLVKVMANSWLGASWPHKCLCRSQLTLDNRPKGTMTISLLKQRSQNCKHFTSYQGIDDRYTNHCL